jgi:hypothetical protein
MEEAFPTATTYQVPWVETLIGYFHRDIDIQAHNNCFA